MDDYTIPITKPASQFAGNGSQPKQETTYPSEIVDLPSQGHFYDSSSPMSNGTINLKIMTAKEEDILTNQNYIKKGVVLDKLIESLIVDKDIKLDDLLLGDKNAVFVATRRFAYGDSYGPLQIKCPSCRENNECTFNLGELKYKDIDVSKYPPGSNKFDIELPYCKKTVTCKLLTSGDEKQIENETKMLQKIKTGSTSDVTTRLRYTIVAVNGNSDKAEVKKFVENELTSRDSFELRKLIKERTPDIDLNFDFKCEQCNHEERIGVPLTVQFFGLTPEDKLLIHEQIFSLAYHSQGAFTQDIAYKLPVYLRIFYLKKLIETKEKEKEAMEKGSKSSSKPNSRPNISRGK